MTDLTPLELPALYPRQRAAIYAPERYSLIEASTKCGKTMGCMVWLLDHAWTHGQPGRNYWWVAPIFDQAAIAFKRIRLGLQVTPAPPEINLTSRTIELPNGATLWFKSGDKPDSLYGEDVYAAVIDEASRVKEESFYAVRSTLTHTRGPIRIIGNVKGRKNWAYQLARKAEAGEPGMSYHKLTAWDAVAGGVLDAREIEDAQRALPEAVFRELYLAEPSDDGGNPFGASAIAGCLAPLSPDPPVCWGVDLAKSIDYTVAVALDARGRVCRFERWRSPWQETLQKIQHLVGRTRAAVDSTGVGDPIVEALQRAGTGGIHGVKFTSTSKQQLMEGLALLIQHRKIAFPDGPIRAELDVFEYEYTRTGVRYAAPAGQHDDCVCALALAVSILPRATQPPMFSMKLKNL
ncbi:MAG: terminase family protein [Candidatus Contendobacter sp.]|nr:terminase family protein [Candidatus Contendobacter sp.]MDG4556046.1 terminase family protein [Candidatus Contendobacter sp.]